MKAPLPASEKARLEALRSHEILDSPPESAHAMERHRKHCIDAGMNDYLSKPINKGELFALIERWRNPATNPIANGGRAETPAAESAFDPRNFWN